MDNYTSLAKLYDYFSFDKPADKWAGYINELLLKKVKTKPSFLLDIGCGTGNVTQEIYKKGYNITAIDSSEYMLDIAAQRFASNGQRIQIINQDMRDIKLHRQMDAALCINDGVNYLISDDDVERAFKSIANSVKSGGVFLFDISSQYKLKSMHEKSYFEENDEGLYIWHNDYDKDAETLTMDISLYSHVEDDLYEKSLETHVQKAHDASFLSDKLKEAGFCEIETFDCFSFDAIKDDSIRIQFAAVKA